jgi:hypothetical protein
LVARNQGGTRRAQTAATPSGSASSNATVGSRGLLPSQRPCSGRVVDPSPRAAAPQSAGLLSLVRSAAPRRPRPGLKVETRKPCYNPRTGTAPAWRPETVSGWSPGHCDSPNRQREKIAGAIVARRAGRVPAGACLLGPGYRRCSTARASTWLPSLAASLGRIRSSSVRGGWGLRTSATAAHRDQSWGRPVGFPMTEFSDAVDGPLASGFGSLSGLGLMLPVA